MLKGQTIAVSWSGGKDCCLALYRAVVAGARPVALMNMLTEGGQRTRSHGLPRSVIEAQAAAMGLKLLTGSATWQGYEEHFTALLREARQQGVETAVFGDIDLEDHRQWELRVCENAGLAAALPLWVEDRRKLLAEWWVAGFEARIIAVRDGVLDRSFLGRVLDAATVNELAACGVDLCGEKGEYHTVVTDGPLFKHPIELVMGEQVLHDGCWFQDVALADGC